MAASSPSAGLLIEALGHPRALMPPCPEERHLIHGDLLHRNVLVAQDSITAAVDWRCTSYVDVRFDVAWFAF